MLTLLSTLKSRLAIPDADTTYDALLTNALNALSARFDHETNRTLARTENFTQEFDPASTEILAFCYPIESVTTFEFKTSESTGWQPPDPQPDHLIRNTCIITLQLPLRYSLSAISYAPAVARVTYTGGYLLPGMPDPVPPVAACQGLPADLEHAAMEQVASWFLNRDKLGLKTVWLYHGNYQQFTNLDLLPDVRAVLKKYERWSL